MVQGVSFALNALISFFMLPYIARILGPDGVGRVDFIMALSQMLVLMASVGLPLYGMREISICANDGIRLKKVVSELFVLNSFATVLVLIAYCILATRLPNLFREPMLALMFGLHLPLAVLGMEWAVAGMEGFLFLAIRSILTRVLSLVMMLLIIHEGRDYALYGVISSGVYSVNQLLNYFWLRRKAGFDFSSLDLRRHLVPLGISFGTVVLTRLYIGLDKIMLGLLSTETSLGLYSVAERMIRVAIELAGMLALVATPRMSRLYKQSEGTQVKGFIDLVLSSTLLLCFVFIVSGLLYGEWFLNLMLGQEFAESYTVFRIGLGVFFCVSLAKIWGLHVLYAAGKERLYFYSVLCAGIVAVVANILLIPRWAHSGAMAGTLIAEGTGLTVQCILVGKQNREILSGRLTRRTVVSCLAAGGLLWLSSASGICWNSPLSVLYVGLLFCILGVQHWIGQYSYR
jgi:O-antigen/teichoic acid export membrane protein